MTDRCYFNEMELSWIEVVAAHCKCTKCHQIVHSKVVNFMLFELYFYKLFIR